MWLPASPPTEPLEFEAARLTLEQGSAQADALEFTFAGRRWRAREARVSGERGSVCAGGLVLAGLSTEDAEFTSMADSGVLCPDAMAALSGFRLASPGFRLSANAVTWRPMPGGMALLAEGATFSRCACEAPPWEVSADSVETTGGGTAFARWPVMRVGGVPVMTAPTWEFPIERRRMGFLLPELAFRGEDGPAARLPVFFPIGQSLDLTPAPGYQHGTGATGELRLRWRTEERRAGETTVAGDAVGAQIRGRGQAGFAGTTLSLDGSTSTSEAHYRASARGAETALAPFETGRATIATESERFAGALRLATLADRRSGDRRWMPAARLGLSAGTDPVFLTADVEEQVSQGPGADESRLRLSTLASTAAHWGPVRASLQAGPSLVSHSASQAQSTALAGIAQANLSSSVVRRFGSLTHRATLSASGVVSRADHSGEPAGAADPFGRFSRQTAGFATLGNRLTGTDGEVEVRGSWGSIQEDASGFAADRLVVARAAGLYFDADALWAGEESVWARVSLGPGLFRPRLGYLFAREQGLATLTALSAPYAAQGPESDADELETLTPGASAVLGPLSLSYDAWLALTPTRLLGQAADARWQGRCQCWRAGVRVEQARPAPFPDVHLTFSLD